MGDYVGLYRGVCVDIADPERRGRIRARVPAVTGLQPSEWALPCRQPVLSVPGTTSYSNNATPALNAGVWVMFEQGEPDKPVWIGVYS